MALCCLPSMSFGFRTTQRWTDILPQAQQEALGSNGKVHTLCGSKAAICNPGLLQTNNCMKRMWQQHPTVLPDIRVFGSRRTQRCWTDILAQARARARRRIGGWAGLDWVRRSPRRTSPIHQKSSYAQKNAHTDMSVDVRTALRNARDNVHYTDI